MEHFNLTIIGAGPAGLTAAIYARRAGLNVLIIERGLTGGQINLTSDVMNYPGFAKIGGMELAGAMREHAAGLGAEFRERGVTGVSFGNDKIIRTDEGGISADAVIIAVGSTMRRVGCKGEAEFFGNGVSSCAVCDGALYQDVPVAVIGGGLTAVEEAEFLTRFASKVYIVHRRDEFRAPRAAVERTLSNPKIEPVMSRVPDEIYGEFGVRGLRVRSVKDGSLRDIELEGVFVFVGTAPNVDFLSGSGIVMNDGGWIKTDEKMETSVKGVFAAGDVRDKFLRQVITAAGDGAVAAMAAYEHIKGV
ncbi:thioredoxin reductase [Synergistales bacterium]|nr:thioredoxin reductase [Synergistales bacterium]